MIDDEDLNACLGFLQHVFIPVAIRENPIFELPSYRALILLRAIPLWGTNGWIHQYFEFMVHDGELDPMYY